MRETKRDEERQRRRRRKSPRRIRRRKKHVSMMKTQASKRNTRATRLKKSSKKGSTKQDARQTNTKTKHFCTHGARRGTLHARALCTDTHKVFVPKWPSRCCPCLRPFSRPRVQRSAVDYFGTSPATLGERMATSMRCSPRTSPAAKTLGFDHPGIFSSFVGQLTDERMLDMAVLGTTSHFSYMAALDVSASNFSSSVSWLSSVPRDVVCIGGQHVGCSLGRSRVGGTPSRGRQITFEERETRSQGKRTRRLRLMGWFLVGA